MFFEDGEEQDILYGYFFWKSGEIYLNSMKIFISDEFSTEEFVARVLFQMYGSMYECNDLKDDLKKSLILELDPEFSQLSKIMGSLFSTTISYDENNLMENQLRLVIKNDIFPKFEEYFIDKT